MQLRNLFLPLLTFVALLVQWNSIEASVDPSDYLNRTRFRRVWRDCRNVLSDDSVKAALTSRQVLESNVVKESSRSTTAFTKKCSMTYMPKKWQPDTFLLDTSILIMA